MQRPLGVGAFEFVILASLRAAQLMRGCRPRVDGGHKHPVTAQLEVSQGKVVQESVPPRPHVTGEPMVDPHVSTGHVATVLA